LLIVDGLMKYWIVGLIGNLDNENFSETSRS